jgi:protein TonB
MSATDVIQPTTLARSQSIPNQVDSCLSCRVIGLEYSTHSKPKVAKRLGGAFAASLGLHSLTVLAALVLGALFLPTPSERLFIVQEVYLGSLGGEGAQGGSSKSEPETITSASASSNIEIPAMESPQPKPPKPKPEVQPEKRPTPPKTQSRTTQPSSADTPTQTAIGTGGESQTAGISASGNGSRGGGTSGGHYEGEFGNGNGPSFSKRVHPNYPPQARKFGKEGVVVLRLTIDESGKLKTAEIVQQAGGGFDEEALEAIKSSTYVPATLGGRAVPSRAILRVRFQLASG